jgi:hypothetical protein
MCQLVDMTWSSRLMRYPPCLQRHCLLGKVTGKSTQLSQCHFATAFFTGSVASVCILLPIKFVVLTCKTTVYVVCKVDNCRWEAQSAEGYMTEHRAKCWQDAMWIVHHACWPRTVIQSRSSWLLGWVKEVVWGPCWACLDTAALGQVPPFEGCCCFLLAPSCSSLSICSGAAL